MSVSVQVPEPEPLDVTAEPMDLDIYYEDQDVLVVNKPRGMVVHPAPGHLTGTLVNGLMAHCDDLSGINGVMRPGIVHRIDKDTSGLLMVAKNDMAHESLVNQLVNKTVTRKYTALVHGVIPHDHGTIDAPIGRDKKDRQSMTVTRENGKHAVTHFEVIERFDDFTVVECQSKRGYRSISRAYEIYRLSSRGRSEIRTEKDGRFQRPGADAAYWGLTIRVRENMLNLRRLCLTT